MLVDWILAIGVAGVMFWPRFIDWLCDEYDLFSNEPESKAESAHISFQADSE